MATAKVKKVMNKKLLIVESPAKAKTIGKYLGADFEVKSSVGHIRDLPKTNGAIKIASNGEGKWTFTPTYVISEDKAKVVKELKAALKHCDEVYLASDPDREGEAIAWHLREVLKDAAGSKPFHRVSYNEITRQAVLKAVAEPGEIDMPRVDAQQARRILDRLVGYKVSPLLWSNITCPNARTLSAGRVQSVALRLLVERQKEIDEFKPETYYLMGVEALKPATREKFTARLARLDGAKKDVRDKQSADNILLELTDAGLEVAEIKEQPKKRHALPPFTTSTLQQAASSVLSMSPGKTMKTAQALYERGLITYMRTDSVNVSEQARAAAKEYITAEFGDKYYPEQPNFFKSKSSAQEAHEAIRPTNVSLTPLDSGLTAAELKVYDLVWRRFVASQMSDAQTAVKTVTLSAVKPGLIHTYEFTASATDVLFDGFLRVMKLSLKRKAQSGEDDEEGDEVDSLPRLSVGEKLAAGRWLAEEKQTKGPTHYSEASLIKTLEENGVGRPSTYAATIETLKTREYAANDKRKLVPLERGKLVCSWLVTHMEPLFNVGYTAKMEDALDKVESEGEPMNDMLSGFYANFTKALKEANPPQDPGKIEAVLALLAEIKEWRPAKKVGRRIYDDKAFVESLREQHEEGSKPLSAKQLESLARLATEYSSQIENLEYRLKDLGFSFSQTASSEKADDSLVRYCFDVMANLGDLMHNTFLSSVYNQWKSGFPLSVKQLNVLAKAIAENLNGYPNADEVREKLKLYMPSVVEMPDEDPLVAELFKLFGEIKKFRAPTKRGKRVYDDKAFGDSLLEHFTRRHTLSERQLMALKRIVVSYKDQIPSFNAKAKELGLENLPSSADKKARVLKGHDEEA